MKISQRLKNLWGWSGYKPPNDFVWTGEDLRHPTGNRLPVLSAEELHEKAKRHGLKESYREEEPKYGDMPIPKALLWEKKPAVIVDMDEGQKDEFDRPEEA